MTWQIRYADIVAQKSIVKHIYALIAINGLEAAVLVSSA